MGLDRAQGTKRSSPPHVNNISEAPLRNSIPIIVLAGILTLPTVSQTSELVNVAKLSDTLVNASSVNAGRELDNVFYGVLNLFDGGENFVNNINYTYWLSDSATRHWVKLRFKEPLNVYRIIVEFNTAQQSPSDSKGPSLRPEAFAVDVATLIDDREQIEKLPVVNVDSFRVIYPLNKILKNVVELTIVFPGPSMIEVAEIDVLGVPYIYTHDGDGPKIQKKPQTASSRGANGGE